MNELPINLKIKIFKHIKLTDLFTVCKQVSKNWKSTIEKIIFKELILIANYKNDINNADLINFHNVNSKQQDYNCLVPVKSLNDFNFFERCTFKTNFEHLKCLYLDCFHISSDKFNLDLNQFKNLEKLIVDGICSNASEKTIDLPNLEILVMFNLKLAVTSKLIFKTPKLKRLYGKICSQSIAFSNVDSITFLSFNQFSFDLEMFLRFKNVETIYYYDYISDFQNDRTNVLDFNFLDAFARLKELHFNTDNKLFDANKPERIKNINNTKSKIKSILSEKLRVKNREFKCYLNAIELKDANFFESLNFGALDLFDLQIRNYRFLTKNAVYLKKIDFGLLEKHFGSSIPNEILAKFTDIKQLDANEIQNPAQLLWFLANCKNVIELCLNLNCVEQAIVDRLPMLCYSLRKLVLIDKNDKDKKLKELNFDFIAKLVNLTSIDTNQFDFKLTADLIERCQNLKKFTFDYHDISVEIRQESKNLYYLECVSEDYYSDKNGFLFKKYNIRVEHFRNYCDYIDTFLKSAYLAN